MNLDKATRRKNGGGAVKSTADRWASNLFYGSSLASVPPSVAASTPGPLTYCPPNKTVAHAVGALSPGSASDSASSKPLRGSFARSKRDDVLAKPVETPGPGEYFHLRLGVQADAKLGKPRGGRFALVGREEYAKVYIGPGAPVVSEATPASNLVTFPGAISDIKKASTAPHLFGMAASSPLVPISTTPGPGAYPAIEPPVTAPSTHHKPSQRTGDLDDTGTTGRTSAHTGTAYDDERNRGVYYRKVRRKKELRRAKRWLAECELRKQAQAPKVKASPDTQHLQSLINTWKERQEEIVRKGRPEPMRELAPRTMIKSNTVHTFGSLGHDATAGIPKDLFLSPGPAAYPSLEYEPVPPNFHDESLNDGSDDDDDDDDDGSEDGDEFDGSGSFNKPHRAKRFGLHDELNVRTLTADGRRQGSRVLAKVLRQLSSTSKPRGGTPFSTADKSKETSMLYLGSPGLVLANPEKGPPGPNLTPRSSFKTKSVSKYPHFFGSSSHESAMVPANDYPGPSAYADALMKRPPLPGAIFSTADRQKERRKLFFGTLQEPVNDDLPGPTAINISSFPSKRDTGPPHTFGGGERTKPPQSVSPGPNFGHRPMASPPTRDTVTGFGGAPRKDLYTVNDNPGPGYYRHTKEFGATATGGLIGKDPTAGANVFSGDQFTQRGTLGPALLLTHSEVEKKGGFMSSLPRTDLMVSKDRLAVPGPGAYGD